MSRDRTALQCANRLLAEGRDSFVQVREARVARVAANKAGIDLLHDDGDLVEPEAVMEEDPREVAAGPLGVAVNQFPSRETAGQGRWPESTRAELIRIAGFDPVAQ